MKTPSIEDILNDDIFGLLDVNTKRSTIKTDDQRLIDSFEEINIFVDKEKREPSMSSMSEYTLFSRLKQLKDDELKKQKLKPYDRHNLLGDVEIVAPSLDDIMTDDDLGLLGAADDLDIFTLKHVPETEKRAETDFVARRKTLSEKEFAPYEKVFHTVHNELKEGKRKIIEQKNLEKNLEAGQFYIVDGVMLYLEDVDFKRDGEGLSKNTTRRKDGRTRIIFENGKESNMYYRSLAKAIYNGGKLISNTAENSEQELFINANLVKKEDIKTGWIYVLQSKSTNPQIANIKNLYKIGFAGISVDERIKNAKNESTYLYADVHKVATYQCYNRNANKLEDLLHRFFAEVCLDVVLYNEKKQRITPREWFIVPFDVIEEAIPLILNEKILNYTYSAEEQAIVLKG